MSIITVSIEQFFLMIRDQENDLGYADGSLDCAKIELKKNLDLGTEQEIAQMYTDIAEASQQARDSIRTDWPHAVERLMLLEHFLQPIKKQINKINKSVHMELGQRLFLMKETGMLETITSAYPVQTDSAHILAIILGCHEQSVRTWLGRYLFADENYIDPTHKADLDAARNLLAEIKPKKVS